MTTAPAIRDRPSPNHGPRPPDGRVDILVLHYTEMADAEAAIARLSDPAAAVSAHYLVDRAGGVVRLVAEDRRAWHAGVSAWHGLADINGRSIGIELDNAGHAGGLPPFPEAQMQALARLALAILARHPIPPGNVVGHSDIAPARKRDPGERFDWRWLARQGVGLWPAALDAPCPSAAPAGPAETLARLGALGYAVAPDPAAALAAFQRRYRPMSIDGRLDAETAWRIHRLAEAVAGLVGAPSA